MGKYELEQTPGLIEQIEALARRLGFFEDKKILLNKYMSANMAEAPSTLRNVITPPPHTPVKSRLAPEPAVPTATKEKPVAHSSSSSRNDNPQTGPKILTVEFNKEAGHIRGKLVPLPAEEVQALIEKQKKDLEAQADAALPENASDDLRQALREYCTALSRTRQKIKASDLSEKAKMTPEEIKNLAALELSDIHEAEKLVAEKKNKSVSLKKEVKELFSSEERLYFRLQDDSTSWVRPFVEKFLSDNGYEVTDYEGGYASNDGGKNIQKIGKVLGKLADVPPGLLEAFTQDPCRIRKNMLVVLTRNPADIARGSHQRAWQSCRASATAAANNGVKEHGAGVVAAYLVSEDDPEIHDPLGRLYAKPFAKEKEDKEVVYFTFNPIGLHCPAFAVAVNEFLDAEINKDKFGKFLLINGCEHYQEMTTRARLPLDAGAAFKIINDFNEKRHQELVVDAKRWGDPVPKPPQKIEPKKGKDGKITIAGDIDLSNLGLHRLPDMSGIEVTGGVNVSKNKLLSLAGLPQSDLDWLKADGTLISSFAGAPRRVRSEFSYTSSHYLVTACGAPEASSYRYGGGMFNSDTKTSQHCISPLEAPHSFPRFKRK